MGEVNAEILVQYAGNQSVLPVVVKSIEATTGMCFTYFRKEHPGLEVEAFC